MKLQIIFNFILGSYTNDNFVIKASSESIYQLSVYKLLENYSKKDINELNQHILTLVGKTIIIDYESFDFITITNLITRSIPNLDEGFKAKMISNFETIKNTVNELATIDQLNSTKIITYLDNTYKKNINLDFLSQFSQIDPVTMAQLQLLKKDHSNNKMIQEIMTDFYPVYIDRKTQELLTNTISVKDLIEFC